MSEQIIPLLELPTIGGVACMEASLVIVDMAVAISRTVWNTPLGPKTCEAQIGDLKRFMEDDFYRKQLYAQVIIELQAHVKKGMN